MRAVVRARSRGCDVKLIYDAHECSTLIGAAEKVPGVRGDLKPDADVPLIVHAGMDAPVRGLDTIVRALA